MEESKTPPLPPLAGGEGDIASSAETWGCLGEFSGGAPAIAAGLSTRWLGRKVVFLPEIDSTNRLARALAQEGAPSGTLVLTDLQTAGRGRLDRSWVSPAGANLLLSLILRPDLAPRDSFRLTMAAGISLARSVAGRTGLVARLKWPNDVFLGERKLAGILTELEVRAGRLIFAVVGVGVNVNAAPDLPAAACLAQVLGRPMDRLGLLDAFLVNLEAWLMAGLPDQELREAYRSLSLTLGRKVRVFDGQETLAGLARDIDAQGALIVDTPQGSRRIAWGEVVKASLE